MLSDENIENSLALNNNGAIKVSRPLQENNQCLNLETRDIKRAKTLSYGNPSKVATIYKNKVDTGDEKVPNPSAYTKHYIDSTSLKHSLQVLKDHQRFIVNLIGENQVEQCDHELQIVWDVLSCSLAQKSYLATNVPSNQLLDGFKYLGELQTINSPHADLCLNYILAFYFLYLQNSVQKMKIALKSQTLSENHFEELIPHLLSNSQLSIWLAYPKIVNPTKYYSNLLKVILALEKLYKYFIKDRKRDENTPEYILPSLNFKIIELQYLSSSLIKIPCNMLKDTLFHYKAKPYFYDLTKLSSKSESIRSFLNESHFSFSQEQCILITSTENNPQLEKVLSSVSQIEVTSTDKAGLEVLDKTIVDLRQLCSQENATSDVIQLTEILKRIFMQLSKLNHYSRIRNISNLLFNLGNNTNEVELSIDCWKLCIKYEIYLVQNFPKKRSNTYEAITNKIGKIGNALYEFNLFEKSCDFLMAFLKTYQKYFAEFGPIKQYIFQLLLKCIISNMKFANEIFGSTVLLESLKMEIYTKILQIINHSKSVEQKSDLSYYLTKSLKIENYTIYLRCLIAYFSLNGIEWDETIGIDESRDKSHIDNLLLSNIFVYKLISEKWDEENLKKSLCYFDTYLNSTYQNEFEMENNITLALNLVLQSSGLYVQAIGFLQNVLNKSVNSKLKVKIKMELIKCFIFLKRFDEAMSLLKDLDITSLNTEDEMSLKMVHYEYKVKLNLPFQVEPTLEKEMYKKLQFSDKSISLIERLYNLFEVIRFLTLRAETSFNHSRYIDAHYDYKYALKMMLSIITKIGNNFSKIHYVYFKISIEVMISKCFYFIIKCLIHLGVTSEINFYLDEYAKFNQALTLPLLKSENNFKLSSLFLILKDFAKVETHYENGKKFDDTILRPNVLVSHYKSSHLSYMEARSNLGEPLFNLDFDEYCQEVLVEYEGINKSLLESSKTLGEKNYLSCAIEIEYLHSLLDSKTQRHSCFSGIPNDLHLHIIQKIITLKQGIHDLALLNSKSTYPALSQLKREIKTSNVTNIEQAYDFVMNLMESKYRKYFHSYEIIDFLEILQQCFFKLYAERGTTSINTSINLFNFKDYARNLKFMNQKSLGDVASDVVGSKPNKIDAQELEAMDVFKELKSVLPSNSIVVCLDVNKYSGDLIVTKFSKSRKDPFYLNIPVSNTEMSFSDCINTIDKIIQQSNLSTKYETTSKIDSKEKRREWWKYRFSLDEQLRILLDFIQKYWLGVFIGLFNEVDDSIQFERLSDQLRYLFDYEGTFDQEILNIFVSLQNLSSQNMIDNMVQDMLKFLVPKNVSDIELKKYKKGLGDVVRKFRNENIDFNRKDHIFLIPGESCSKIPWESLDCLKNRSVTRMPSISLLIDLLRKQSLTHNINKEKVYYVLNPEGDLLRTQSNFELKFKEMPYWTGTVGKPPNKEDLIESVLDKDLYIYLGHGGGEQYLSGSNLLKISKTRPLPPSLLIGCSSGTLNNFGLLEDSGYVYNWLIGGSPLVLVNLWDVTDKDIDAFSLSLFNTWGLFTNNVTLENISQATSKSREACNLKYLNGGSPILYGLPLKLLTN